MSKSLAALVLCSAVSLFAYDLQIKETGKDSFRLVLSLDEGDLKFENRVVNGITYTKVNVGHGLNQQFIGEPDLPRIHKSLALSSEHPLVATVQPDELVVFQNIRVTPVIKDTIDNGSAPVFYEKPMAIRGEWYLNDVTEMGKLQFIGNAPIQPLTISPMSYQPSTQTLRVYKKIVIDLKPSLSGRDSIRGPLTPFVVGQVEALALNGTDFAQMFKGTRAEKRALILTTPELKSAAMELSQQYLSSGLGAQVVEATKGVPSTNLKTQILSLYQSRPVDFVLLMGDEKHFPLFAHESGELGDAAYSFINTGDELADVSFGRLPVRDIKEANYLVAKLKRYRELSKSGTKRKDVIMVAHGEDYPGKYTANSETIRKAENPKGFTYIPQYGGEKATNQSVLDTAMKGAGIINYRGHGSEDTWIYWDSASDSFGENQVKQLQTTDSQMPFIFNVACDNGAIQNDSKALVRHELIPTLTEPYQGAIGTFGATEPSYTEVNHQFNIHLFNLLQTMKSPTIGEVYAAANNKLVTNNGGKAPNNVLMYLLYSDPTLKIWVE